MTEQLRIAPDSHEAAPVHIGEARDQLAAAQTEMIELQKRIATQMASLDELKELRDQLLAKVIALQHCVDEYNGALT